MFVITGLVPARVLPRWHRQLENYTIGQVRQLNRRGVPAW